MSKSRSFRDYHYDHSDILLAVIILIIAAALIVWRINIIMAYPSTLGQKAGTAVTAEQNATTSDNSADKESAKSSGTNKATWTDDKLAEDFTLTVEGSSADKKIQCLIDAGLFTSSVDFKSVCKSFGLNASSIKSGTYTFSQGMTKKDIAKDVIK